MSVVSGLRLLSASTVLIAGAAAAADMPGDYPTLPPPAATVIEPAPNYWATGWYLRADLGYRMGNNRGAESTAPFPNPSSDKMGNAGTGGLGFGLKMQWFRGDITATYSMPMTYTATVTTTDDTSAKITAHSVLANGYIDLGTWYGITPYVGAGAGFAYVRTSEYTSTAAPPFTAGLSNERWNFAWAGMAGLAYQIGPNLQVDVGYRYISLGDAETGRDAFGGMVVNNITAHEVRAGLRWSFDDLPGRF